MIARYKTRKLPNTTILYKDFFKENLNQFQLVLYYLGTSIEEKVGKKLNKELSPDSLIISEIFKLSVLNLKKEINVQWGIIKTKIYLYTPTINVPTKK